MISILVLEGIYFYNFTTPEFNVNVCQLPFWALSIYFTWRCIEKDKTRDYFLLGLFIGLGILSKYLFIYLVIGIKFLFIYLFFKRKKISLFNIFIPSTVAIIILLPHLHWLINNEYETIFYGLQRAGGIGSFFDHLIFPLIFTVKQIGILIPFFILFFFLIKKINFKINFKDFKFVFLFFTTITPILLILFTSMILGVKIMTPLFIFWFYLSNFAKYFKTNLKFTTVFLFFTFQHFI